MLLTFYGIQQINHLVPKVRTKHILQVKNIKIINYL